MFNLVPWKTRRTGGDGGILVARTGRDLSRFGDPWNTLWDRFWALDSPWAHFPLTPWGWSLDVDDREDELVVRAEAPGFEPAEFRVEMRGNQLVIEAEHKEETQAEQASSYRYGKFQRSVTLPQGLDVDKIHARYRSGILEVHLPKGDEARPKRIPVNGS
jgi:HSP20 family protein